MVLEEINAPYAIQFLEFSEVKEEAFTKINPNGRLPAIEDPNTGITLWEVRNSMMIRNSARNLIDATDSQEPLFSTSLINTTKMGRSHTKRSPRSILRSSGSHFRSLVRPEDSSGGPPNIYYARPRTILWPSDLVCSLPP